MRRPETGLEHAVRSWAVRLAGLALGCALLVQPARAAGFVADLSDHLIAITTAFAGTDVLLFGALEQPGGDVAVVVRGPATNASVRHKARVGFLWVYADAVTFQAVPGYYAVAASRPLAELGTPSELARHEIGTEHLRLEPVGDAPLARSDLAAFRAALVRGKQRAKLYPEATGSVSFLGRALFRTRLSFPANVPPGAYLVQVFQFVEGHVVSAQTSVLEISKIGLEAEIFDVAIARPAVYALASILLAIGAGWTASAVFRRA